MLLFASSVVSNVSIHASSREDATWRLSVKEAEAGFQSTRPRGRTRHKLAVLIRMLESFNPRVLAGGRDIILFSLKIIKICFNPRVLAGGRDMLHDSCAESHRVSIHASSREDATTVRAIRAVRNRVSIHASSREDATGKFWNSRRQKKFQSTRPRGRTRHAERDKRKDERCFNPRVLAGGRDA